MARNALSTVGNFLRCAGNNEVSPFVAAVRPQINDMVGALDDIHIMFNDNYRVASLYEGIQGSHKALDVMEMQSRGRFVKDEQGGFLSLLTDEIGQFDALVFTTGERA